LHDSKLLSHFDIPCSLLQDYLSVILALVQNLSCYHPPLAKGDLRGILNKYILHKISPHPSLPKRGSEGFPTDPRQCGDKSGNDKRNKNQLFFKNLPLRETEQIGGEAEANTEIPHFTPQECTVCKSNEAYFGIYSASLHLF